MLARLITNWLVLALSMYVVGIPKIIAVIAVAVAVAAVAAVVAAVAVQGL